MFAEKKTSWWRKIRMEKKIDFNEMNVYVRYVQYVSGEGKCYYQPWRILYDNFLIYVVEGSVIIKFDNSDIKINENELCIIPPFLRNKLEVASDAYFGYYGIHFDFCYDESEKFNEDVYIPENLGLEKESIIEMPIEEELVHRNYYYPEEFQLPKKIKIHQNVVMRELLEKLLLHFQKKSFGYELLTKAVWYELFYLLISEIRSLENDNKEDSSIILQYIQNLEKNSTEQLDIAQIALEYGMTPRRFRDYFKELTAKTPKKYLLEQKIERAKRLLETGRYRVSDVAYMLGYDDVFYFSKLFKRKTGVSPKHYMSHRKD